MKKLLLSLLLLSALVFQSCKKTYSNVDENLPIVFSQAGITKTTSSPLDEPLNALVLGSKTSNDWTTIYGSADKTEPPYANGKIKFDGTSSNSGVITNSFNPAVLYPLENFYIYIKALVPCDGIDDVGDIIGKSFANSTVTFTIDGESDIMATKPTELAPDVNAEAGAFNAYHGCGSRKHMRVKLIFDHLLSKIDFHVQAESLSAQDYWGDFKSVTFLNGQTKLVYNLAEHKIGLPVAPVQGPLTIMLDDALEIPTTIPENNQDNIGYACSAYVFPHFTDDVPAIIATPEIWEIKVVTEKMIDGVSHTLTHAVPEFTKILEKGKRYKVILYFKDNTEIGFSVTTTPWNTTSTGDIII